MILINSYLFSYLRVSQCLSWKQNHCMLKKMPRDMAPLQPVVLGAELSANHSKVSIDEMEPNYFWEQCGEEVNATERENLHDEMKELCNGNPIIHVEMIPISKNIFDALAMESDESNRVAMVRMAACGKKS